jgi:hypothetical protein
MKQPRISVYVPEDRHDKLKTALSSRRSNFTKWVNEKADEEIVFWQDRMKKQLATANNLQ